MVPEVRWHVGWDPERIRPWRGGWWRSAGAAANRGRGRVGDGGHDGRSARAGVAGSRGSAAPASAGAGHAAHGGGARSPWRCWRWRSGNAGWRRSASRGRRRRSSRTRRTPWRASWRSARRGCARSWRRGRVVIVAGFQGVSRDREVTTLGRGGSDTTAVALAAALGADRCEIFTDVDGVYTADPRRVPGARKLERIDYDGDAGAGDVGREGDAREGGRDRCAVPRSDPCPLLVRGKRRGR